MVSPWIWIPLELNTGTFYCTVDPDLLSYASESETLTLELNIVCYTRYKYIKKLWEVGQPKS